jgi:hypothetical protein
MYSSISISTAWSSPIGNEEFDVDIAEKGRDIDASIGTMESIEGSLLTSVCEGDLQHHVKVKERAKYVPD